MQDKRTISSTIDQHSIFDLMGLSKMSQDRKDTMLVDINALIWNNFLAERLPYILTGEQIANLRERIDKGVAVPELLSYLTQLSPNFPDLLTEYTRVAKLDLISKHYGSIIADCENMFPQVVSDDEKDLLRKKREKYTLALELLRQAEWVKIISLLG